MTTLLHIGYHKTGSTWLQHAVFPRLAGYELVTHRHEIGGVLLRALRAEPDARYPEATIRTFFSELTTGFSELTTGTDADVAGDLVISSEDLSGNQTQPAHATRTAERLARAFPTARVLVVIRRQDHLTRSLFVESLKRGVPLDAEQFLHGDPADGALDPARLRFCDLIGLYRELFGPDQVVVLPFELLADRPAEFLAEIAALAGTAAPAADLVAGRINTSPSDRRLRLLLQLNRLDASPRLARFRPPLWRSTVAAAQRRIYRVPARSSTRVRASRDTFDHVLDDYRIHNRELQELCTQNLGEWGYY